MTRLIASSTVTKLEGSNIFYAELIQLHLKSDPQNDNVVQYTTANVDLTVSTPTSSSTSYVSQGQFINFGNLKETADLQIQSLDMLFTAVDTTTLAALVTHTNDSGKSLNGRRVVVYRIILGNDYSFSADDVYMIFDGSINGFSVSEEETTATLSLNCSSKFINFEATTGRKTTIGSQQLFFPKDEGMEFASALKKDVRWGQP